MSDGVKTASCTHGFKNNSLIACINACQRCNQSTLNLHESSSNINHGTQTGAQVKWLTQKIRHLERNLSTSVYAIRTNKTTHCKKQKATIKDTTTATKTIKRIALQW